MECIKNYELKEDPEGAYMVASRNLTPGEVIFIEKPGKG